MAGKVSWHERLININEPLSSLLIWMGLAIQLMLLVTYPFYALLSDWRVLPEFVKTIYLSFFFIPPWLIGSGILMTFVQSMRRAWPPRIGMVSHLRESDFRSRGAKILTTAFEFIIYVGILNILLSTALIPFFIIPLFLVSTSHLLQLDVTTNDILTFTQLIFLNMLFTTMIILPMIKAVEKIEKRTMQKRGAEDEESDEGNH